MTIKYTIDRGSLIKCEFEACNAEIISGSLNDEIEYKAHLPVIYAIIKRRRIIKENEQ